MIIMEKIIKNIKYRVMKLKFRQKLQIIGAPRFRIRREIRFKSKGLENLIRRLMSHGNLESVVTVLRQSWISRIFMFKSTTFQFYRFLRARFFGMWTQYLFWSAVKIRLIRPFKKAGSKQIRYRYDSAFLSTTQRERVSIFLLTKFIEENYHRHWWGRITYWYSYIHWRYSRYPIRVLYKVIQSKKILERISGWRKGKRYFRKK